MAGDLIDQGQLAGAQLTLAHSSPDVTKGYSRREMRKVQDVMRKRLAPYFGRPYDRCNSYFQHSV